MPPLMRHVQHFCYFVALACVALAVPLAIVMIWTETYEGIIQRLLLSAVVTFLGSLAVLVVIQTVSGRRGSR